MIEQFHIGFSGENHIKLKIKWPEEAEQPEFLRGIPEFLEFNIQIHGDETTFDLHYYQCEELMRNIEFYMKCYKAACQSKKEKK